MHIFATIDELITFLLRDLELAEDRLTEKIQRAFLDQFQIQRSIEAGIFIGNVLSNAEGKFTILTLPRLNFKNIKIQLRLLHYFDGSENHDGSLYKTYLFAVVI